jgi:hypothetical protein
MTSIEELIQSGRIVDIMILFILLEIVLVEAWRRRHGRGVATLPLLVNIGAGGSLMLALRASLMGSGWQWVAVFLVASLVFHVADLRVRWGPAER